MADPINPPGAASALEHTYEKVRAALATAAPAPDEAPREVAPQVRVIALRSPTLPPATHTNCYVLGPTHGAGQLVLVDPGSPYPESQAVLDEFLAREAHAGRSAVAVLLTHHHADHTGGAAHLRNRWDLEILAHQHTQDLLRGRVEVDRVVGPGHVRLAGQDLELLHTPGHAAGHLCAKVTAAGATLAGDMVAGVGTILIEPDEGDMAEYLASLAALQEIDPGVLLPAHGPPIPDGPGKLTGYRTHRLAREQKIAQALRARGPCAADELVPLAYADTPAPFWPLAERSTLAHLIKLEREGRARRDGQRWVTAEARDGGAGV